MPLREGPDDILVLCVTFEQEGHDPRYIHVVPRPLTPHRQRVYDFLNHDSPDMWGVAVSEVDVVGLHADYFLRRYDDVALASEEGDISWHIWKTEGLETWLEA